MDIELTKEVLTVFGVIVGAAFGVGGTLLSGHLQRKWSSERLATEWKRQDHLRATEERKNAEERLLADVDAYLERCAELRTYLGSHLYAEIEPPVAVVNDGVTTLPSRTATQQEYSELVGAIVRLSTLAHTSLSALRAPSEAIESVRELLRLVHEMQTAHSKGETSGPIYVALIDTMSALKGIVLDLRSPEVAEQEQP